jgi:hypothetical protein
VTRVEAFEGARGSGVVCALLNCIKAVIAIPIERPRTNQERNGCKGAEKTNGEEFIRRAVNHIAMATKALITGGCTFVSKNESIILYGALHGIISNWGNENHAN